MDLQQSLDSVKKKHEEEIALLNKKISYLTLDSNKLKEIETECELLRKQLAKYQKSKQHQQTQTVTEFKLVQQNVSTQTDKQDDHFESGFEPIETECPVIEDEPNEACLNDIFKDTILPWMMLSPLRCSPKPIGKYKLVIVVLQKKKFFVLLQHPPLHYLRIFCHYQTLLSHHLHLALMSQLQTITLPYANLLNNRYHGSVKSFGCLSRSTL